MENHKQKAFTLAELTLAIVIISILIVGFAPVITKRLQDNIKVNANTQGEYKLYLFSECEETEGCTLATGVNACDCKFSAPQDAKLLNVVMVSGGGAGGNATESWAKRTSELFASENASNQKTISIVQGMHDVVINYISGSGGGGGGGAWDKTDSTPKSQSDCNPYNAKFLTAAQNGKPVCVTKFNIGDIPGLSYGGIADSVYITRGGGCDNKDCCWQGRTTDGCDSSGTNYSGCSRTLCTWQAAYDSCANLAIDDTKAGDWRLPTMSELSRWSSNIKQISVNQGDNGLRLCDEHRGFGSPVCAWGGDCGSSGGACKANNIWSADKNSSGSAVTYDLGDGRFYQRAFGIQGSISARCVYEGSENFTSLSGGGGGGAAYIKNYTIPQSAIQNALGGKIILKSAPGGAGGKCAASQGAKGSDGSDGKEALIEVKDKNNKTIWALKVLGGKGGKGATNSSGGTGGAQSAQNNSCQIYENNAWKNVNCTGYGQKGSSGAKVSSADETTAAQGGSGGGSAYNSDSYSGGGRGGSASVPSGGAGTIYGAGGGGGTVGFDSSGNPKKGGGAKGYMGAITIEYKIWEKSAAGGGGGGGAFAKVRDINITPGGTYDIRIGGGGTPSGYFGNDGNNGGDSFIKFGTLSYILSGGKGGKGGKIDPTGTTLTHGGGGAGATTTLSSANKADSEYHNGKAGSAGANVSNVANRGGRGGESGIKTQGGCGGMFSDPAICTNPNANGISIPFVAPDDVTQNVDYGSAGSGGGGGGWSYDGTRGVAGWGAKGQDGYVYIYWSKN